MDHPTDDWVRVFRDYSSAHTLFMRVVTEEVADARLTSTDAEAAKTEVPLLSNRISELESEVVELKTALHTASKTLKDVIARLDRTETELLNMRGVDKINADEKLAVSPVTPHLSCRSKIVKARRMSNCMKVGKSPTSILNMVKQSTSLDHAVQGSTDDNVGRKINLD